MLGLLYSVGGWWIGHPLAGIDRMVCVDPSMAGRFRRNPEGVDRIPHPDFRAPLPYTHPDMIEEAVIRLPRAGTSRDEIGLSAIREKMQVNELTLRAESLGLNERRAKSPRG